jgi:hypothetical protein
MQLSLALMQPQPGHHVPLTHARYACLIFGQGICVVTMQSEFSDGAEEALRCNVLWLLEDDVAGGMFRSWILVGRSSLPAPCCFAVETRTVSGYVSGVS